MFIVALIVGINFACGFIFGKFHERIKWNKLIDRGIINKPH